MLMLPLKLPHGAGHASLRLPHQCRVICACKRKITRAPKGTAKCPSLNQAYLLQPPQRMMTAGGRCWRTASGTITCMHQPTGVDFRLSWTFHASKWDWPLTGRAGKAARGNSARGQYCACPTVCAAAAAPANLRKHMRPDLARGREETSVFSGLVPVGQFQERSNARFAPIHRPHLQQRPAVDCLARHFDAERWPIVSRGLGQRLRCLARALIGTGRQHDVQRAAWGWAEQEGGGL